ncbi:MAG: transglycosylase SLT domain-containing protein [Acetobacteraceae bacterium]
MIRRAACLLAAGLLAVRPGASAASDLNPCEQAAEAAEQAFALPAGLLRAIGQVESGRWDTARRRVVPWPWAIGSAGSGRLMDSKPEAEQAVRALQTGGVRNIDVGCFQVNLMHHPDAFRDLEQAFDPLANASYAARFLASLRVRLGNWDDAVAAYHSADPARGIPYRRMVQARWTGPADTGWASEQTALRFGIRIWTPSRPGAAPNVITPAGIAAPAAGLPRIIVPTR